MYPLFLITILKEKGVDKVVGLIPTIVMPNPFPMSITTNEEGCTSIFFYRSVHNKKMQDMTTITVNFLSSHRQITFEFHFFF